MRTPDHRPTRREAEQLLDDPAAHGSALGTLLAAAASPALPGELRREDAEVAAFRRAGLVRAPAKATGFVSPRRLASQAAARAVIATSAVVALTTGGFALANSAHLPGLPGQPADQATESAARSPKPTAASASESAAKSASKSASESASESASKKTSPSASKSPSRAVPSATTTGAAPSETPSASTAPTPNYEGLCRAFQATDHAAHGSSLDSAAFSALSAAAGGDANIATWCVALIGEPQDTGKPTDKPTPTSKPTDKPKPTPTEHPTGKPSTPPGKPTDKPTPTDKGGGSES